MTPRRGRDDSALRVALVVLASLCGAGAGRAAAAQATDASRNALAARIDHYVAKQRVLVLTDIANEPDDQMSLVRFLVYANHFDVEGLVATTSTWMKRAVRPDVIRRVIDAYEQVQPNLLTHAPGFPTAAAMRRVVTTGQPTYGMDAVGPGKMTPGAELIIQAADRDDPRPLWITVWGGANTLAQALLHVRATRTPEQVARLVSKLRVYAISDQDDAGPWLRREFPALHYIALPSTQDGDQYAYATWTGISGDRFYQNAPGADFTTFTNAWVDAHIRSKGPLGALYPRPCCIHEGDTPSFLGLIDNGLSSAMSPTFAGGVGDTSGGSSTERRGRSGLRAATPTPAKTTPGTRSLGRTAKRTARIKRRFGAGERPFNTTSRHGWTGRPSPSARPITTLRWSSMTVRDARRW